ncbi:hypothetical protein FRC14_001465 [Serendipita sp. 396]|nr:hypothetical protein FRC14_001465 [Serendipita sp. 396]KAG8782455.1 hypothetical protein FRC15_006944 [Serendipita sp. 397]KAG8789023.1 hypothetical protein FRC16_001277 [Serendipita sp. 398]KAG8815577.1 hypothetical protein FRC19_000942 [Serendipita sp. 401]KAG8866848.1 hypothetical protein FRC20_007351 [Serendipita sp. 405]KAG9048767.1 hypothetical protein FS842_000315 [Serendipita sp. 407]
MQEAQRSSSASKESIHSQSGAILSNRNIESRRITTTAGLDTDNAGVKYQPELLQSALPVDLPAYYNLDEKYKASKAEIWSYYLYLAANSGATLSNFAPTAFQNLLSQAAGDAGVLPFAGRVRSVNSIVLLSNGLAFAIQTVMFLILGSFADFGTWRPNILIVMSFIGIAVGFAWLSVHTEEKWMVASVLYILGLISFQTCWTFWVAAFPGLARSTSKLREAAKAYKAGSLSRADFELMDSMKRNEISNMSFAVGSAGSLAVIAIGIGIFNAPHVNDSAQNNNWGLSVFNAFGAAAELVLAAPWFILEKRRPGLPLPSGMNIFQAGIWQLYRALKDIWKLRQSLLYLIVYFLLGDALNTSITIVSTLQNQVQAFNSLILAYLLLVSVAAQAAGVYAYWSIQHRYQIRTKTMLTVASVAVVLMTIYGFVGIWVTEIGFHSRWEFWGFQVYFGFFVCPWYNYSQTMISEITPRGKDFFFFSLFGIIGKTSSFIGPLVSSAIIDNATRSGNTKNSTFTAFYFLMPLSVVSTLALLFGVDVQRSKREQDKFLLDEQAAREDIKTRLIMK